MYLWVFWCSLRSYRNWMLSGNMDLWVTEYVESRCLGSTLQCRLQCEPCSTDKFNAVSLCFNYSSELCFWKRNGFSDFAMWRMSNVNVQCNFGQFSATVAMYFAESMLTAFFICSLDNEFNISTVSQRDTHLGYSQGLEQSVILFHLRTLGQKSSQLRESIRVQFDYNLRTVSKKMWGCPQNWNNSTSSGEICTKCSPKPF